MVLFERGWKVVQMLEELGEQRREQEVQDLEVVVWLVWQARLWTGSLLFRS